MFQVKSDSNLLEEAYTELDIESYELAYRMMHRKPILHESYSRTVSENLTYCMSLLINKIELIRKAYFGCR